MIEAAVRRWRWRNVAEAHPSLHEGCNFEPIFKLLGSRRKDSEWNATLRGMLKSVVANRQFPQSRCYQAGWVQHSKCICCLHAEVSGEKMMATMSSERAEGGKSEHAHKAFGTHGDSREPLASGNAVGKAGPAGSD